MGERETHTHTSAHTLAHTVAAAVKGHAKYCVVIVHWNVAVGSGKRRILRHGIWLSEKACES